MERKYILILLVFFAVGLAAFFGYPYISRNKPSANEVGFFEFIRKKKEAKEPANILEPAQDAAIKEPEPLSLLFFGDMMLDRHVGEKIAVHGLDHLFENIATGADNIFLDRDLVGANLEGAVTDGGAHYPPDNVYDFAFDPQIIKELKRYNFSFFTLSNNHFADQGERGIMETRKNLKELGYFFVGCKDREVDDCSVYSFELKGKKIGMAAFSMVYGRLASEKEAYKRVKGLKEENDLVLANIHWGREYEHNQNATQINIGRELAKAGADIVIGHHPHVVQGMEVFNAPDGRQVPIFYSLGNFIFDQYFSLDTQEGLALELEFLPDKSIIAGLLPLKSEKSRARLMDESEKEIFFKNFFSWSDMDEKWKTNFLNENKILLNGKN